MESNEWLDLATNNKKQMTTKLRVRERNWEKQKAESIKKIKWDKKSTIWSILILCGISLFLFFVDWGILFCKKNYTEHTTGTILKIEEINMEVQTRVGNKTQTIQYLIECAYEVNNRKYVETIYVPCNFRTNNFLLKIGYPENKNVEILFQKNNPEKYLINTDYNSNFYKK